jgi:hypothetical protein
MKMWRPKSDKALQSVSSLLQEQLTHDASIEHVDVPELYSVPVVEVTVIDESPVKKKYFGRKDKRLEIAVAEGREHLQQLGNTNELVDKLIKDLNKSRSQAAELINHNTMLLEELKAVAGKDDATIVAHRMMRQELNMLKGGLFFSAIFIFCGGRAELLSLLALVWMVVDISA